MNGIPTIVTLIEQAFSDCKYTQFKSLALVASKNWISYGVRDPDLLESLLTKILACLLNDDTFELACDVLCEIIGLSVIASVHDSFANSLFVHLNSDFIMHKFQKSLESQDQDCLKPYCTLLVEAGEKFVDLIYTRFESPFVKVFLGMLLALTLFPGYFGKDEEISSQTLYFWFILQDTSTTHLSSSPSSSNFSENGSLQAIELFSKEVFSKLVVCLNKKVEFPSPSFFSKWPRDIQTNFHSYRHDCEETLVCCYFILKEDMLGYLLPKACQELEALLMNQGNPESLEATLFCIQAVSEAVAENEVNYIPVLFGLVLDKFHSSVSTLPWKVTSRFCHVIGKYAEWLCVNSSFVPKIIQFLISCLSFPENTSSSVAALLELCQSCPDYLVNGIDSLILLWDDRNHSFKPEDNSRLLKSMTLLLKHQDIANATRYFINIVERIINLMKFKLEKDQVRLIN